MLTDIGYSIIRPPKEKCTPVWRDEVMNAKSHSGKGFREYCMMNSCTDEGLEAIAKYNNFVTEYKKEVQLLNKDA